MEIDNVENLGILEVRHFRPVRIQLSFWAEKPVELPINYQEQLIGFIYHNINNEMYRKFLHEEGYSYNGRIYKHFAFSRLNGRCQVNRERKTITFHSPFTLMVASPIDVFVSEFAHSLLLSEHLRIGSHEVQLERFDIMPDKGELPDVIRIRMLSPLVVYSTLTHPNGLKHTYYYRPHHELFSSMVEANLKRKYFSLYPEDQELAETPFLIRPIAVTPKDKVITRFRGIVIEGWMGEYQLSGDPRLLRCAYHSCLGSKGSQGFGFFEVVS